MTIYSSRTKASAPTKGVAATKASAPTKALAPTKASKPKALLKLKEPQSVSAHQSIPIHPITIPANWNHIYDQESFQIHPEKDGYLKRLAYTMIEYAIRNEDALEVLDFCIEYKISRRTLYDHVDQDKGFREAYDYFKLILANRKRRGAMKKEFDYAVVKADLYKYDPEYISSDKYQAQLKQSESLGNSIFVINNNIPEIISKEQLEEEFDDVNK